MAGKNELSRDDQKKTLVKVMKYIKKYRMLVVLSLIFAAVTVVTTLYLPILTGNAVDMMVKKGKVDFVGLKPIVRTMLIVLVITGVAQWIMNICNNYITYHVVQDIRKDAMDRIQIVPLKYLDGHAAGDIVSRVIADADQFADGLLMGFTQAFTGVMTIIGTLGFMLWINGWITLVVILVTPLSFFCGGIYCKEILQHVPAPVQGER